MLDLSLDSDFSVSLNDKNDLATATDRKLFEQDVAVRLTDYFYDSVLGESDIELIKQKVRLQVNRVARDDNRLNEIQLVSISRSQDKSNTLTVRIVYESDEVFEVNLSE
jgi:hypothetical protein